MPLDTPLAVTDRLFFGSSDSGSAGSLDRAAAEAALRRAAETVAAVRQGRSGTLDLGPRPTNARLYEDANPLPALGFAEKTRLLAEIDAYARGRDPRVRQVMASIAGEWQG